MKCFQCHNTIQGSGILISIDGDFVCDEQCKKAYEAQRDDFLNRIVHNKDLCRRWLYGENV
jgi:hypothetical protein